LHQVEGVDAEVAATSVVPARRASPVKASGRCGSARRPIFVATVRPASPRSRSSRPTSCSLRPSPYTSAVSRKLTPASAAACSVASASCSLTAPQSARWKIENETFNVLKTNGYHLEHNFGHGKETLASVLVTLNLLAFALHTAARLALLAWRQAVIARGATYRFFEHLRTVTAYVVFENWDHLLRSIEAAAVRPP